MRLSSLFTFVAGLAVAGGSAYMAREFLESKYAHAAPSQEEVLVDVIVAGRDIALGQTIESHLLTTVAWPVKAAPSGSVTDFNELIPQAGQPPRRARRAISQGEPILISKISDFGEKVTIVQSLSHNHRAMAIKVNAVTAVGGFVTPGDHVDVLLTQGRDESLRTVTILQNTRVIGVDQDADENSDAPEVARTVTVEVLPEDGQKLALAQKAGTLSLALRTVDASNDEPLEAVKLSDVMRELSPVPDQAPSTTIKVRRGVEVTFTEIN
ncbi:Flp pilus assembly protein CpaB [Roseovarius aestuarii]|uniref:SAF domain protein n=1 Tax=Roseovarius aestuarii TaxID=475083 RepID=A0A1X7BYW9_9RHOB|nr:Flp pilus assembly protein CpaB [Roseovarius aestuarii]SMC14469.1 SAF domain protein [Roseovarius aestuarii]